MNLIKLQRQLINASRHQKFSTSLNNEYTPLPEYPPIEDKSYESKIKNKQKDWANAVRNCHTVEEKQIKLNMPKYYGWKTLMLNDKNVPYSALPLVQYCTRTHLIENSPPLIKGFNTAQIDQQVQLLQPIIEEAILFQHDILSSNDIYQKELTACERENIFADRIIKQINRIILNNLSNVPHLANCQVDIEPRHEAFWFIGGIDPPTSVRKSREGRPWTKHLADEPVDRAAQYMGTPSLAVRSTVPLETRMSLSESENPAFEIPKFTYDPKVIGYNNDYRHGTNIPGFWPGDHHPFGLISYQRAGHLHNRRQSFGSEDQQEALFVQAILSSFSWLLGQVSYQGFTTYNDLTYPLLTQNIITDGRLFSFYTYQLNTIVMHGCSDSKRSNVCWSTTPTPLFAEIAVNKLIGFNTDVLKNLIGFYLSETTKIEDLQPYLHENEKIVADIGDDERREWLEKQYKHLMANKPVHRKDRVYEVYHWEKIYKIDNKTRPMEPRRRPFELDINPTARTLDQTSPIYIPKNLRPGGPKSKVKFYKTYWP